MYKSGKSIIVFVAISALAAAAAQAQSDKAKKLDELLAPLARSEQFSGVVVASENGKVIYEKAFGVANAEFKIPTALNSRIGIASVTKSMTSIILIRLIEEQKLGLDDKLSKFIPDFPAGDKITVAMLSQHRSGIPHRVMPDELESVRYTSAQMVETVKAAKLAFEPGSQRVYSSGGYAVLARVLEIASGQAYSELLKKYIFAPAGMTESLDWDGGAIIERRAQDYIRNENGYSNAPVKDYSFLVGAGSVLSTAADIHKFALAVVDGKYGAAVSSSLVREGIFSSTGTTNGRRAYVEMRADKAYGLAVLSNMSSGSFDYVQRGVTEILQGKEPTVKTLTIPKFVPNPNKDLNEFVGSYIRADGGRFNIALHDGYLWSSDIKMHPVKPDCFFDFRFYGSACFSRDAGGKVNGLRWTGLTFDLASTREN